MAEVWAAELNLTGAWPTSTSSVVWDKVFRLITSKVYEGFELSMESSSVITVKDDRKPPADLSQSQGLQTNDCACSGDAK